MSERGLQGWELIQLVFGKDGEAAFWKRKIVSEVIPQKPGPSGQGRR
jgi:hypothetical protein